MGQVYRACDTRLGREVAIKLLADDLVNDPAAAARFEREWRTIARLSHPNILALYDVGREAGLTFAVMELVPGASLRQRLAGGALPAARAVDIAIQIARGLHAAHQANVVHRDLKPENVIVSPAGHITILDFGLARDRLQPAGGATGDETVTVGVTETGVVLGTRGYMAPEQVRAEVVDHRADIFALGTVLYEMLAGRRAFMGPSPVETLHAVLATDPDMSALPASRPALRRIVSRCLEKRPEDRFNSALDVAYALEAVAPAEDDVTAPGGGAAHVSTWWRSPAVWVAGALLVTAGAGGGRLLLRGSPGGSEAQAPISLRAQLQGPPGVVIDLAFSPDGRRLGANAASGPDASALWTRETSDASWRQLAPVNLREAGWLAWSPDGRSLLYPALDGGAFRLRVVDIASGAIRTLFDSDPNKVDLTQGSDDPEVLESSGERMGGAWGEAGILVGGNRLRHVSPDGGVVTALLNPGKSVRSQRWPTFLPDGRTFVFTQAGSAESDRGVFIGRVGSPAARRLLPVPAAAVVTRSGHLVYAHDGTVMAAPFDFSANQVSGPARVIASGLGVRGDYSWFTVSPQGTVALPFVDGARVPLAELELFDRTGLVTKTIGEPDRYSQLSLSPDGSRVLVESERPAFDIITIDKGLRVPVGYPSGAIYYASPVWSPDGLRAAAVQYAPGPERNLCTIDIATGRVHVLVRTERGRWPQAWTGDGREIVVSRWETGGSSVFAIPVDDPAAERRLSPEGAFVADKAAISPDDGWVAYHTNETGAFEVYVQPRAATTGRRRISPRGGMSPAWSDRGRELFYLQPDGTFMVVPFSASMMPGPPAALFRIRSTPAPNRRQFAVLPGAQRFVFISAIDSGFSEQISVVTNWTAILER